VAPFFDEEASVLRQLVARLAPKLVALYLGNDTSVDGDKLTEALGPAKRHGTVYGFTPQHFVHAKLLAAITGASGRLLSGCAFPVRRCLAPTDWLASQD
jgi:hypothetical protein